MPRVERSASSEFDQFGDVISDDELTRQLRHRIDARDEFDDSIPPAENDFEADCAGIEPSFASPGYRLPLPAMAEEMPPLDEPLMHAMSAPPPSDVILVSAPVSSTLRVLTITLAFIVAAGAGFLLMYTAS